MLVLQDEGSMDVSQASSAALHHGRFYHTVAPDLLVNVRYRSLVISILLLLAEAEHVHKALCRGDLNCCLLNWNEGHS